MSGRRLWLFIVCVLLLLFIADCFRSIASALAKRDFVSRHQQYTHSNIVRDERGRKVRRLVPSHIRCNALLVSPVVTEAAHQRLPRIKDIEAEIARTQKNKATAGHLGLLKVCTSACGMWHAPASTTTGKACQASPGTPRAILWRRWWRGAWRRL